MAELEGETDWPVYNCLLSQLSFLSSKSDGVPSLTHMVTGYILGLPCPFCSLDSDTHTHTHAEQKFFCKETSKTKDNAFLWFHSFSGT